MLTRNGVILFVLLPALVVVATLWHWWADILTWAASPVDRATTTSNGEALRNLALLLAAVVAAFIGIPLAV